MFQNLTFCTENFADTPSNLSIRGTKFFKTEAYLKNYLRMTMTHERNRSRH